jgi:hypothetical protein
MHLLIPFIIVVTIIFGGNKFFNKSQSSNNKKVFLRKVYTTNELCFSTLTEKYSIDDFWNENKITFNNYKYKVIDKNGTREFIPENKDTPELFITPTEKDNCLNNYNKKIQEQIEQEKNNILTNKNNQPITNSNKVVNCEINKTWIIYPNEAECRQAQINFWKEKINQTNIIYYNNSSQNDILNYQIPTLEPLPTLAPLPKYKFPTYEPHPTHDFSYLYNELKELKNIILPTLPTQKNNNCKEIRSTGLYNCEANSLRPL